jgi:hypothetical protein
MSVPASWIPCDPSEKSASITACLSRAPETLTSSHAGGSLESGDNGVAFRARHAPNDSFTFDQNPFGRRSNGAT